MQKHDPDDEDWYDADDADEADASAPCPQCGAEIYADLDHCPQCGHWLSDADHQSRETGLFATGRVRIIAGLLLAIFLLSLLAELFLLGK